MLIVYSLLEEKCIQCAAAKQSNWKQCHAKNWLVITNFCDCCCLCICIVTFDLYLRIVSQCQKSVRSNFSFCK